MPDIIDGEFLITMDPAIKAAWVSSLRATDVKQGKMTLLNLDDDSMCCLGVLSELACQAGVVEKSVTTSYLQVDGHSRSVSVAKYGDSTFALSKASAEWAGMKRAGMASMSGILPFTDRNGMTVYLDSCNDSGMPFSQIADLIEYWY